MIKYFFLTLLTIFSYKSFSQKILTSWSQQNIENYTREMYDQAQKLTASELLNKNLNDKSWSAVFLTLNASINNYSKDSAYLKELTNQITDSNETKLEGTSRLIIWDRVINGDIIFEGKGLVIDNDLFKVGGRANQILQNLTNKNFGFVTIQSTKEELEELKNKWVNFLTNKSVDEYRPIEYKNSKIPEISSLTAVQALIVSLQDNPKKHQITKNCLKNVYNLDEMPKEKGSQASYCNPDTYTFSYLGMLFGDSKFDETKDAKWWQTFWDTNHNKLVWNSVSGIYEVKK
ncbi:MAG: hypothetical protein KF803_11485 [Cyclobacteriaceae bacterium]|nr:hypothetical protein [Cyclobacteriaceae bacterium]